jgi:hypothetical protein
MGVPIDRLPHEERATLTATLKTAILPIHSKAGGGIMAEADFAGDTIAFEVGAIREEMVPLYDGAGAAMTVTIGASQAVAIPEDAMKFAFLRLVASGAGAAEGQHLRIVTKS